MDHEDHQYYECLCGNPKTASNLCLDQIGLALLGSIVLTWGLSNKCRIWSGLWMVSGNIGIAPIWYQILVAVTIVTCLILLINIIPSALGREGIQRIEDVITSRVSHQSTIPLLHLAQIFRQTDELVALDINMELLEVRVLYKQLVPLGVMYPISTSDTMPRA